MTNIRIFKGPLTIVTQLALLCDWLLVPWYLKPETIEATNALGGALV